MGLDQGAFSNGHPFHDGRSKSEFCVPAEPDGRHVFRSRRRSRDPRGDLTGVPVVVRDVALFANRNSIFDNHFPVYRKVHQVADRYAISDDQSGIIQCSTTGDANVSAKLDVISDLDSCVS